MSVQQQLLLLLGLTAALYTADARRHHGIHGHRHHGIHGRHHLPAAPSPQPLPHLIHGHHHHNSGAAPPQALPVFYHGHHHHGIAEAPKAHPVSNTVLEEKCKLTNNPDVCFAAASHYARAYPTIDNLAILDMLITAAIDGSHGTAIESSIVAGDAKTPALLAKNLDECPSGFKDAVDNLNHVKDAVAKGDKGTVLTYLSAALDNVSRCNDIFVERPAEEKNPMAHDTKLLVDIISTSLGFANVALGSPY